MIRNRFSLCCDRRPTYQTPTLPHTNRSGRSRATRTAIRAGNWTIQTRIAGAPAHGHLQDVTICLPQSIHQIRPMTSRLVVQCSETVVCPSRRPRHGMGRRPRQLLQSPAQTAVLAQARLLTGSMERPQGSNAFLGKSTRRSWTSHPTWPDKVGGIPIK